MLDRELIEQQYKKMTDSELIMLANNEADKLTPDAFYQLKNEFENRNLDEEIIKEAEINRSLLGYNQQKARETIAAIEINTTIWQYALDQKAQGDSNSKIYQGLLKKRVNEDYAFFIIEELENKATKILDDADTNVIACYITISASIIAMFMASSGILGKVFMLYGFILIVFGLIALYRNTETKSKYKKILKNIAEEKEPEDE